MKLISSVGANDIVTMGFNPWIGNNPILTSAVGTDDKECSKREYYRLKAQSYPSEIE